MLLDLRHAARNLRRHLFVTAVAVLTLGIGIGGATAVFSVVDTVLLQPLPFHKPARLARIWELTRDGDRFSFSEANYLDLQERSRMFMHMAAYREVGAAAVLNGRGGPQRIAAVPVTASLLDVLGVRPAVGRMFDAGEDRPGTGEGRIVLGDSLWRTHFGSDRNVVGRTVTLDGDPFVVTGIMPPGLDFPEGADAWVPLRADTSRSRTDKELAVVGRLAAGATMDRAGVELRAIANGLAAEHPVSNAGWSAEVLPFDEWIVAPRFRDAVWVLFGAVGLLLLLACANVANLLVAQAATRQSEMRVRAALGAGRPRLIRQLFTESGLLATLGTGAGVLIAFWSVAAVQALGQGRVPRLDTVSVDARVLGFACVAGAVSAMLFGLAPAWYAARMDLSSGMDRGGRHTSGGRHVRRALVVTEVALALVLLVGAGLLATSFLRLMEVDAGFGTEDLVAMPLALSGQDGDRTAAFYRMLVERVRGLPGVTAAAATSTDPFRESGFSNDVTPEEQAAEAPPSGLVQAGWRSVTPGFFKAMRVPLLRGRGFDDTDGAGTEGVVIVSRSLAERLWPGGDAVGRRIYWGGTTGRTRTVVGVAGDIRDVRLDAEPAPMLFLPHVQVALPAMTVIVRTSTNTASLAPSLHTIVRDLDATLPAPPVHAVQASREGLSAGPRFNLYLLATFAGIALVLAVTGVYAMLAFTVGEQRREIAVRLALGADGSRIAALILRTGLALAAAGVAIGAVTALVATRVLSSLLYGVDATDPVTFGLAALGLLAAAGLACYMPAREAARLDPLALLRE